MLLVGRGRALDLEGEVRSAIFIRLLTEAAQAAEMCQLMGLYNGILDIRLV